MKTLIKKHLTVAALALTLLLPNLLTAQDAPPPGQDPNQGPPQAAAPLPQQDYAAPAVAPGGITLQTFYDQLAPYGQWVNYPNYGYVFIPSVAPGFMPYSTGGHWAYGQYGWTWASDYPWGWAAFHYGRWNYDASYGWFWAPDLNWGPAWVAWRNCEGYYGWAPLAWGMNIGVGFGNFGIPAAHWCFVPQEHLCEINLGRFFVPRVHYDAFIAHSTIINRMDYDNGHRFGYFKGPDRVEVEGYTHHPVEVVNVGGYRRPGTVVVEHNAPRQENFNHGGNVQNNAPRQEMSHGSVAPQRTVELHSVPQRGVNVSHASAAPQRAAEPQRAVRR